MITTDRRDKREKREVVVITGASAGVGRAVARVYGARGACGLNRTRS
jgi:NADP-dependent 3-hydroxy acid dehydrogenase YdfG